MLIKQLLQLSHRHGVDINTVPSSTCCGNSRGVIRCRYQRLFVYRTQIQCFQTTDLSIRMAFDLISAGLVVKRLNSALGIVQVGTAFEIQDGNERTGP